MPPFAADHDSRFKREPVQNRNGKHFDSAEPVVPCSFATFCPRIAAAVIAFHVALLAWGGYRHSPVSCEVPQLPAGISHWQLGTFELYKVNPPLVRMLAAMPVIAAGANTNWTRFQGGPGDRPEFMVGADFVLANGPRSIWLYTIARWACIPFSILGAYVCWRWARDLYGASAGLTAVCLWCFSPDIIAHGQLITTDVAAAALAVTSGYLFWRWLKRPTWTHALAAGIGLGVAQLTKMTLLIFFGVWPAIWIACILIKPSKRSSFPIPPRQALQLLTILTTAMVLLNAGYGFDGTGTRLGDYLFVSAPLRGSTTQSYGNRFAGSWLHSIPIPLPNYYVLGLDEQKRDFEFFDVPSYLHGTLRDKGWWYYYLYGMAVKTPAFVLAMLMITACSLLYRSSYNGFQDVFSIIAPAGALFLLVSSQTGFSIHYRYVLPVLPFLFVFISRLAPQAIESGSRLKTLLLGGLISAIVSSLATYPHSSSYFNELAGGPFNGHFHMVYSSQDWGQDLLFLQEWRHRHPESEPLHLAYYGEFDPRDVGIIAAQVPYRQDLLPSSANQVPLMPGWYAVSTSFLRGVPSYSPKGAFAYFLDLRPSAYAGYSIYIYQISEEDVKLVSEKP